MLYQSRLFVIVLRVAFHERLIYITVGDIAGYPQCQIAFAQKISSSTTDPGFAADVAVEDVLVVVVSGLDDLVAFTEKSLAEYVSGAFGVEGFAKFVVEVRNSRDSTVKRGENLNVLKRAKLKFSGKYVAA